MRALKEFKPNISMLECSTIDDYEPDLPQATSKSVTVFSYNKKYNWITFCVYKTRGITLILWKKYPISC